ncbi:hypothetical protein F0562_004053 [Nyssa sinensis]|uniref:Uncharacterized protein n=1 Tax=Nyssa sinensis TaxID=561372 RepID=A0A5J5BY92_9ASTE|nr:hypothetical protein F0562_004053 [Nyssa sinensis]
MEQEEKLELNSPLPVLPRLDRLDRLLQLLEEKHGLSGRHSSSSVDRKMESEDQCKSLSTALEEVHHKGTLMERLAILENRVLQEEAIERASMTKPCQNSRKHKRKGYRKSLGWFRIGC